MKPKLLLYITADSNSARNAIASTLAWATQSANWLFEVYYDSYRLGDHYGGGDPDSMPHGLLTGGTLVGAHHHERLYLLLHQFDTLVLTQGHVAFDAALRRLGVRRLESATTEDTYEQVFATLGVELPASAIITDAAPFPALSGLDAYSYPEIVNARALGFEASSLTDDTARWLAARHVHHLHTLWLGPQVRQQVEDTLLAAQPSATIETLDSVDEADRFQSVTERISRRWSAQFPGGWILADPLTVSAWLPEAVRERRLAIYGKPQREIIRHLGAAMQASDSAVLGRQYEDADFFDLSALGLAFQLIDPGRPPFPVLRYAGYDWQNARPPREPRAEEPDDVQLAQWAREGRILTSVIFWSGMIRELENLPRIVDLVALTRLKAGLALSLPSFEYQPEAPLELLRVPLEQGGVFPHLEVLLASCGLGASIESRMPIDRLRAYLAATIRRMDELALPHELRPVGWWTTMDADLIPRPRSKTPITPAFDRRAPFVRLRYASSATRHLDLDDTTSATTYGSTSRAVVGASSTEQPHSRRRRVGAWVRRHGLEAVLAPYRPYELYTPGDLKPEVMDAARAAGLQYVFSKSGFGDPPRVLACDDDFIAMNYTVGRWDGWTPFETINDMSDLRIAERRLVATQKPGWLVGSLDSCLWTFTGPIWSRGAELHRIATFLANGGDSGRMINVTPRVVARYARIVAETDNRTA